MARRSQNGWPVVTRAACDQGPFAGVTFPNGILAGDVATIARWQLERYEATVEQLVPGLCWGFFDKKIEGSTTISNHASGTAWDINAERHPMGVATANTFHPRTIAACRAIVKASDGVLRWGGDYTGRPDAMHWEIVGTPAQAATLAHKLRETTMPDMTQAEFNTMLAAGLKAAAKVDPLATLLARSNATTNNDVPKLLEAVDQLAGGLVDVLAALSRLEAREAGTPDATPGG